MRVWADFKTMLGRLHWRRGLRAGLAVVAAMIVCRMLNQPIGWAALGGFEAILVDNGGPYRSRLATMATVLVGGAVACVVGAWAAPSTLQGAPLTAQILPMLVACVVTAAFCFAMTFARVIAQPVASTSVVVLVLYFAGYGGGMHSSREAAESALAFLLGGAWAAVLSLALWPVDPFRPARQAVAECYEVLANFTAAVRATPPHSPEREAERLRMNQLQRTLRVKMETARGALETTGARTAARTVRARNLTVLLETADILFASTIRWVELLEGAHHQDSQRTLLGALEWVAGAERAIAGGLEHRPADAGASFAPEGSHSLQHVRRRAEAIGEQTPTNGALPQHLVPEERDALQNVEIAFESVRAVWSGEEVRAGRAAKRWARLAQRSTSAGPSQGWLDAVRANWTGDSIMMRHALRVGVVGGVDVLLMRMVHVSFGSWLAMTSIIVLQPYGSGTLKRTLERVAGTIGGGVLAAVLVAGIRSEVGLIVVITITAVLTLATYAVDYAWFTFFLTPTFVLMSLPYLQDWHFAGLRIGMTVLGAVVALSAMRLLWPEREQMQLSLLLGRGAGAGAAYVRAILQFWTVGKDEVQRAAADREMMAPARRRCGLAINDAEEALDRLMMEPSFGLKKVDGKDVKTTALTFVTYLWRLTRSVTTLGTIGTGEVSAKRRIERIASRLDRVSAVLAGEEPGVDLQQVEMDEANSGLGGVAEQQILRMERQVGVMERAAREILQETA